MSDRKLKIAIDGMGGDRAPAVIVDGAIEAAAEFGCEVILVGDEQAIKKELSRYKPCPRTIHIRHAPEVVQMHEPATTPIRRKKASSISVCAFSDSRQAWV